DMSSLPRPGARRRAYTTPPDPVPALFQYVGGEPVGCLDEPVVIRPQGIATVVLRAGKMQRDRRFEAEMAAQLRGLQIHRLGHVQDRELPEQPRIGALQD